MKRAAANYRHRVVEILTRQRVDLNNEILECMFVSRRVEMPIKIARDRSMLQSKTRLRLRRLTRPATRNDDGVIATVQGPTSWARVTPPGPSAELEGSAQADVIVIGQALYGLSNGAAI